MSAIIIEQCKMSNNDIVISKKVIVKFIYILAYFCIYVINYKRINAYFNKKEEEVEEEVEEVEEEEKEEKDWDVWTKETKHKEKDVNKWYIVPGRYAYRYKGEWANGYINGKGVKEYYGSTNNNHSILECNFVDGKANGYGKQTYDITRDEEEFAPYYEGEFKDNLQHGKGTYYYGNGCYRKGNLVEGKFEGKGFYYDSFKKRTWVGTYVNDKRDLDNGVWYDGELTMEDHELNDKDK